MSWNYRVMKHTSDDASWYGLHEVFYDGDKVSYTANPAFVSDSLEELKDVYEMIGESFKKPILDFKDE